MRNMLHWTGIAAIILGLVGASQVLEFATDCRLDSVFCISLYGIRLETAFSVAFAGWMTGLLFIAAGHIIRLLEDIRTQGERRH